MLISLILAHPNPGSFNHALAKAIAGRLSAAGHDVRFHDLCEEGFDPLVTVPEVRGEASRDELVERHCQEIADARGIVVVHPNWWGQSPAVLKGWLDRVLRLGVAYDFPPGDPGAGEPVALLKVERALVVNTSDTEPERERAVFGDPLERIWKDCVFGFCGVGRVERLSYGVLATSDAEQRARWLNDAADTAQALFAD